MSEHFKPASQARKEAEAEEITYEEVINRCKRKIDTAIRSKQTKTTTSFYAVEGIYDTAQKVAQELTDAGYQAEVNEANGFVNISIAW